MKLCQTVEDGVRAVLAVYRAEPGLEWSWSPAGEGELVDHVVLDGVKYPLFWWRCDPQVRTLKNKAPGRKICSMKLNRSGAASQGLQRLLYRELDIAEYVMGTRVHSLMNFQNGNAMNMLCTMENDCVALFELAAVLHDGTPEQGRHTYWGEDGMASDRVVSQKVASGAVYLFTEEQEQPEIYNDLFLHVYGLGRTDTLRAVMIAELLMERCSVTGWLEQDAHCCRCVQAAERSARDARRIDLDSLCESDTRTGGLG